MIEKPTPKRRWVKPLLAVSLICNMLIIGVVAGIVIDNRGKDRGLLSKRTMSTSRIHYGRDNWHWIRQSSRKGCV